MAHDSNGASLNSASFGGVSLRRLHPCINKATRLPMPERSVVAIRAKELLVRALLYNTAMVEHDQAIHAGDSRKAMRDRDHGLARHQGAEALLDRGFDLAVERGGGFVEHQDRSVFQDHTRDRDALALAARELDAALAHLRVIAAPSTPILQHRDELFRVRKPRRLEDLVLVRFGTAIADVLADRAVQK